jgi:hypothetical protein
MHSLPPFATRSGTIVVRDVVSARVEAYRSVNPVIGKKLTGGRIITAVLEPLAIEYGSAGGMNTAIFWRWLGLTFWWLGRISITRTLVT